MWRWTSFAPLGLAVAVVLGAATPSEAQIFGRGGMGFGIGFGRYGYPGGWGGYPMMGYGSGIGFGRGFYGGPYYSSYGYSPYYNYGPSYSTYQPQYYGQPYNYQGQANYYQSAYQAQPMSLTERDVLLDVRVPNSAEVWVNGDATTQTGARREFMTNDLTPGKTYTYSIKARWNENGKPIEREKKVRVHGGEQKVVDFNVPT